MGARWLALLAVPMLLSGCADLVTPVAHSTRPEPTYVRITVAPANVHGSVSLHDAIRFVHITGTGADIEKELEPDGDMRVRLPNGGEYLIASWTRPCRSTCSTLRPPIGRCSVSFIAATGRITAVEIRSPIGKDCSIAVSG